MNRADTSYTRGGKQMTVQGDAYKDPNWAKIWDALAANRQRRVASSGGGSSRPRRSRGRGPTVSLSDGRGLTRKYAAPVVGSGIPIIPADMSGPAQIDWARVAAQGIGKLGAVKAAAPDFL
jgi:hypothetical protein